MADAAAKTILVVDDEHNVVITMADILQANGYAVLTALSGEEALRAAEAHAGPIALLLCDVVMPVMGGAEVAERLRATRPETRVLFVSGFSTEVVVARGIRPGDPVLVKPVNPDTLVRKVRELLDYRSPFTRPPARPGR